MHWDFLWGEGQLSDNIYHRPRAVEQKTTKSLPWTHPTRLVTHIWELCPTDDRGFSFHVIVRSLSVAAVTIRSSLVHYSLVIHFFHFFF